MINPDFYDYKSKTTLSFSSGSSNYFICYELDCIFVLHLSSFKFVFHNKINYNNVFYIIDQRTTEHRITDKTACRALTILMQSNQRTEML